MNTRLDVALAATYKSGSQIARILTESWVAVSAFCPGCGRSSIHRYANNRPAADFYCGKCGEDFELKSKQGLFGGSVVDGAYRTMIQRLNSQTNPNLFLLSYDLSSSSVSDFCVVPKHFLVPGLIRKRKPLALTARRAGWVGCNILLSRVPQSGRIFLIRNKRPRAKKDVLEQWQKTLFLRDETKVAERGWLLDVMRSVEGLGKREFSLAEVYACEVELARLHPANRHVRDKIRQQLQYLRDRGFLQFIGRGHYRLR